MQYMLDNKKYTKEEIEANLIELLDPKWYASKYSKVNNEWTLLKELNNLSSDNQNLLGKINHPQELNKKLEYAIMYWLKDNEYKPKKVLLHQLAKTNKKFVLNYLINNFDINEKLVSEKKKMKDSLASYCIKRNISAKLFLITKDFNILNESPEDIYDILKKIIVDGSRVTQIPFLIKDLPECLDKIKDLMVTNNMLETSPITGALVSDRNKYMDIFRDLKNNDLDSLKEINDRKNIESVILIFIIFFIKYDLQLEKNNQGKKNALISSFAIDEFNEKLEEYSSILAKRNMKDDLKIIESSNEGYKKKKVLKF